MAHEGASPQDRSDPGLLLPHRFPFLLLDRVLSVEPGSWAIALKNVTRNEPLVDADGVLPPALLVEVMAQTAGVAVSPAAATAVPALLARVDRFRCRPSVVAGDQLVVSARVQRRLGANVIVRSAIVVGGRRRAAAELVLHFHARPES